MRFPLQVFSTAKSTSQKLAVVSLYDAPTARLCSDAGCDAILVGDSLGSVVLGLEGTQAVTMVEMQVHAASVARGVMGSSRPKTAVVADLPFAASATVELAVHNAALLVRCGVHAVKLEGAGTAALAATAALTEMGVPVMGHLGFTPQSAWALGSVVQAKTATAAATLLRDAQRLQQAGCFALVLEAVPIEVAARLTAELAIATIGIGSGGGCDGQVLVWHDLVGLTAAPAFRFVKRYADVHATLAAAAAEYVREVHEGAFPDASFGWPMSHEELARWNPDETSTTPPAAKRQHEG